LRAGIRDCLKVRVRPCGREAALTLVVIAATACAAAAGGASTRATSGHVLVGVLPQTGFEVTCDDSLVSHEPIVSDELGIVAFEIDQGLHESPNTVSIRVPAPPVISGEHVADLGDTSATISWMTDRPALSLVAYGLTDAYGQATPLTDHYSHTQSVVMPELTPETTYHYRALSVDAFGHTAAGVDHILTTLPLRPRMSEVTAEALTTSIAVSWRTSRLCDTRVEYGLDELYGSSSELDPTPTLMHEVVLEGLLPNTTYHVRAWSVDEFGRPVDSGDRTAATLPQELVVLGAALADTNATTATIVWTTSVPATSQVEYGATEVYGQATVLEDELVTEHLVVLDRLTPETLYHFRVASTDTNGQAAESGDGVFSTRPAGSPETIVVYRIGASALSWNSATVSWVTNLSSDSTVEYGLSAEYGSTASDTALEVYHDVTLPALLDDTVYHYRVTSVTESGTTVTTDDQTLRTLPPPLEISGVAVADADDASFTVQWTTNRPASALVEYGPDETYGSATAPSQDLETEHSVTVTGLSPATTYHFRAVSTDAGGYTATSADSTASTTAPPLLLFDTSVPDTTDSAALIEWRTSNPASSRVEYGTTETYGLSSPDDTTLSLEHSVALTGLAPDTWYHFRVVSVDAYLQETVSADGTFLTRPEGYVHLVIEGIAVSDLGPSYATVSWVTNRNSTSVVEYGTTETYGLEASLDGLVSHHTVLLTGLEEGTLYHFRVKSGAPIGAEAVSDDQVFSTPSVADLMPPAPPQGLAAVSLAGAVALAWEANAEPDLAAYRVYRRPEGGEYACVAELPSYETAWTDDSVVPGVFHEYAVTARDGSGNESDRGGTVTAIAYAGPAGGLWAYPNPARDGSWIRFAAAGEPARGVGGRAVSIFDAAGRLVTSLPIDIAGGGCGTVHWDLTDSAGRKVPSGVYFCAATFDSGEVRTKLMVVR